MTKSFICTIAATSIAVFAFAAAPTIAHAKTAKACEAEYKAGKADLQKAGTKKTDFMTTCRAQPEAAATDTKTDKKAADTKADKAAAAADKKAKADAANAEKKAKADQAAADQKAKADQAAADKKAAADAKKAAADAKKTAAKPAATEKPATTTTGTRAEKPAAPKPAANEPDGKQGRVAFVARERACGADWKTDKAAGKTGDQTWPQYWSDCNKRKKAQGM
jgi:hypothetical protein